MGVMVMPEVRSKERTGPVQADSMVVAVDTREQLPYTFPRSERMTLSSGDYSIVGLQCMVAIERKTKRDALKCLSEKIRRFERELVRLADYDYAAIIVESTLQDFLIAPSFLRIRPEAAAATIVSLSVEYRIPVFFAGNRELGNELTYQLLQKYLQHHGAATNVRS